MSAAARGGGSTFVVAFLGNVFPPLVAIATAPILAQALGVTGRGEVAAATAPLLLALAIATLGIPEATVNAIARSPQAVTWILRRGTAVVTAAGLVATGLIIVLTGPLSAGSLSIALNMAIAAFAVIPNLLMAVLRSAAMGLNRWWDVTVSRLFDAALRLLAFSVLALTEHLTVTTATIVIACAPVIGGLNLLRVVISPPSPSLRDDAVGGFRPLVSYGLQVWIGAASGVLLSRLDQLLMVPLANALQLGLYAVAVSISEVSLIANSAVREVMFASESAQADDRRVALASRISTLITLGIALAIGLSMPLWLAPLFGEGFGAAYPVAILLLIAVVAGNPGSVAGAALSGRGRPGLRSLALIIAAVVNLGLLILLVPAHGAVGAAIATMIGNLIASNLNIVFLWRHFGVRPAAFYAFRPSDVGVFLRASSKLIRRR